MSKIIVENNTFNSPVVMGDNNKIDYQILSDDIEILKKQVANHTEEIKDILLQLEKAMEKKDDYKVKSILKKSYDKLENLFVGFSSSYLANIIS